MVDMIGTMPTSYAQACWLHFWVVISTLPNLQILRLHGCTEADALCTPFLLVLAPKLTIGDLEDDIPRPESCFHGLGKLIMKRFDLTELLHGLPLFKHLLSSKQRRQAEALPVQMEFTDCELPS